MAVVGLPQLPVVARAVAHSVRILALDDGARLGRVIGEREQTWDARIHGADDVGGGRLGAAALIVNGSAGVAGTHVGGHGQVGGPITSFIAERPDYDGRVVLIALHHAQAAVHDRVEPERVVGRHDVVIVERGIKPVCLEVGLVHKVDAILIAQLIPADGVETCGTGCSCRVVGRLIRTSDCGWGSGNTARR